MVIVIEKLLNTYTHMKKILFILVMSCGLWAVDSMQAQQRRGVPATPHPIEIVQPDGDTLTIRLHGDERKHWRTTEDGYLIAQNKKGVYCYAKRNEDGTIQPTCRQAHNADQRKRCEQRWIDKHIEKREIPTYKQ